MTDLDRNLGIGAHFTAWNGLEGGPDLSLKRGALNHGRVHEAELFRPSMEVA